MRADGNIRWRIDRWDPLECRLDARDVDESERVRESSSDFGRLCRLLCEGGPAKERDRSRDDRIDAEKGNVPR